jgi:hypothetical protein
MEVKKTHDALTWLHEKYLEDPNGSWDIARVYEPGADVEEIHVLGKHLVKKGYVKNHCTLKEGFTCSITPLGINQVSNVFSRVKYLILEASIERNERSIMEILNIEPGHFKRVHDYATYLKRLGIIECIFHPNDVLAEPTFFGREWYQENKLNFVN